MTEIWLAFMAGLAGSGHCIGMCGGIIAALSVSAPQSGRMLPVLAYHCGRILTYSLLGLLAGAGSRLVYLSSLKPFFLWMFLLAQAVVGLLGLATMIGAGRIGLSLLDGTVPSALSRILKSVAGSSGSVSRFTAGLAMGLLPCGMVYGVLIPAGSSGSGVRGAAMMLAFGAGTLPSLLLYGKVAGATGMLFRRIMGGVVALLCGLGVYNALLMLGIGVKGGQ